MNPLFDESHYASWFCANDRVVSFVVAASREGKLKDEIDRLRAELAQQAEPVGKVACVVDGSNLVQRLRSVGRPWQSDEAALCDEAADEIERLLNELDALKADAHRYRWIASRRSLTLRTDGDKWTRRDGTTFISSHYLSADGRQHEPGETLDEIVDKASSMC